MPALRQILAPHVIRIKKGAIQRLGIYLERERFERVLLLKSEGLPSSILDLLESVCRPLEEKEVLDNSLTWLESALKAWDERFDCVLGVGGGKALDVAKLAAFRLGLPYFAVPTSLSNDGFCSPQSSLVVEGRRVSLKARLPLAVVVDLDVVKQAPLPLWLSGVGDLVSKWTALHDWRFAFHQDGTPFDDLAALLSDATVFQFMAHPLRDERGVRLLAQGLLFNGVAMEMAGSSRPASGSEHLISHALDRLSAQPKLHGLQVGLATYWMSLVQGQPVKGLAKLFEATGFWEHWVQNPGSREEWLAALEAAPSMKQDFVTVLSVPENRRRAAELLLSDPYLGKALVRPSR